MTRDLPPSVPTATVLRQRLAEGRVTAEAIVLDVLERIATLEPAVHAWETLDRQHAIEQARALDARRASGAAARLLDGVPVGVKDIIDTADLPTGYGSAIYRGSRPKEDAGCVALARSAGAVVMGKTVSTEFAYFTPGPTANPWNAAHTPGGSSSGSAAAVACGMLPLALGTQTAGSVIRPASYCGVFALKPTFGAFSLAGVRPFSPSLDTLGWFARCADDLELMRCAFAGVPFRALDVPAPQALQLAVSPTHEAPMLDADGAQAFEAAQRLAAAGGIEIQPLSLPASVAGLLAAQKTIMAFEARRSFEQERLQHAERLSAPLLALIDAGGAIPEAAYAHAREQTKAGREIVDRLLRDHDALLVPGVTGEAPAGLTATGDPVFCRVWTLLGLPCVNVPGLRGPTGLPIGVQLVGRAGEERPLLAAAACLRRVLVAGRDEAPDESAVAP
jgi:Asp-tRNA(Asn)/Glu-tRNA(Gln) amidotransferase A subunit family amidase